MTKEPVYAFREGLIAIRNRRDADPMVIGQALAQLGDAPTPPAVVEAARDPKSPLHRHFEWDDSQAAHAHRLDQARELIRVIVVTHPGKRDPVPAWVSIRQTGVGVSWHSAREVLGNQELQQSLMENAARDLGAWERRYRALSDLCPLIRDVREKLEHRIKESAAAKMGRDAVERHV